MVDRNCFQELKKVLAGEIQTLAYPPAALFALCTAFVAYNMMRCIILSIEVIQPEQPLKLSTYYIGHEIASCCRGLYLLTENHEWDWAAKMTSEEIGYYLFELAKSVKYENFTKRPPSKKIPIKKNVKRKNHVSTKKLLNQGK
jgi:hypothetical protein